MPKPTSSIPLASALAVVITLFVALPIFSYFLPRFLSSGNRSLVARHALSTQEFPDETDDEMAISQELLEYIRQSRLVTNAISDKMDENDLIEKFEELQVKYASKAQKILSKRFSYDHPTAYGGSPDDFTVPQELAEAVEFWTHVFGVYDKDVVIFYNQDDVGIVYTVLDFDDIADLDGVSLETVKQRLIAQEKNRLAQVLKSVAQKLDKSAKDTSGLTAEEKRLFSLLSKNEGHIDVSEKGLVSSLTLRFGFAHRMRDAIILSGQYMAEMREIFAERGLPEELTIIPFVESSFSPRAFSSAGAAGIWQFIEQTGKNYLRIDEFVDERYDPILSTYAAALHLSREYAMLKAWPLAINAYNTGPGRILDAVNKLGTRDIAKIVKNYKGSGYGFDSRNYFPEFLAALEIYNNREHYFGVLRVLPPQGFEYIAMPFAVNVKELLRLAGVSDKVVTNINLTLRDDVFLGEKNLPKGYLLKVPSQTKEDFLIALQELYSETRLATHHMVDKGESLKDIAKLYGISTEKLIKINGLLPSQKIKRGDILMLPVINDDQDVAKTQNKDDFYEENDEGE